MDKRTPEEIRAKSARYRLLYPDRIKAASLLRKKIRATVKQDFFDRQAGLCLYCGKPMPADLRKTALDHDHRCHPRKHKGCVNCWRGLLHTGCNVALARVEHDTSSILRAIEFLQTCL